MPRHALTLLVLAGILAAGTPASADTAAQEAAERAADPAVRSLAMAREELGFAGRAAPRRRTEADGITVSLRRSEAVAATRTPVEVVVDGPADRTADVAITLPPRFAERAVGGRRFVGETSGDRRRASRQGRLLRIGFTGERIELTLPDQGLPAGSYAFGVRVDGRAADPLGLRLYAPAREATSKEGPANPFAELRAPTVVTNDSAEQSETFVTVAPSNPNRIAVGYNNDGALARGPSLTTDGGASFTVLTQPQRFDVKGSPLDEDGRTSGDPMSVADPLGNIWYGGLSVANPGPLNPSRIYVNRIDPVTNAFQAKTVGLDFKNVGQQDKNMMAIDNAPSSPTFGRLYVVWGEPGNNPGSVRMSIVFCDTRPGGVSNPANCDNADNWSDSTPVYDAPDAEGSYIYADVAVGPDGTVHFVNWDYSANNAIVGASCTLADRKQCGTPGSFGPQQVVAGLQEDPAAGPVPFACSTLAQPGGRTGPAAGVETDLATGRVWVNWGDLRTGSGSTRCAMDAQGATPPSLTNLTWDVFAATAVGALPVGGAGSSSAAVGTKVSPDTASATGSQFGNTDDWFAWIAVDQSTGRTWMDYYSTADDATRRTARFSLVELGDGVGSKPTVELREVVSTSRSDYSTAACCNFGNDYGDYSGIDAAGGVVVPVWTSRTSGDGDALIRPGTPAASPADVEPPPPPATTPPAEPTPPAETTPPPPNALPPVTTPPASTLPPVLTRVALGPTLTLGRTRRTTARARGIRPRLGCAVACSVSLELRLDAATTRRLRRTSRRVGRTTTRLVAGVRRSVNVRLSPSVRTALTRDRRARLTLRASFTDPRDGSRRTLSRAAVLTGRG